MHLFSVKSPSLCNCFFSYGGPFVLFYTYCWILILAGLLRNIYSCFFCGHFYLEILNLIKLDPFFIQLTYNIVWISWFRPMFSQRKVQRMNCGVLIRYKCSMSQIPLLSILSSHPSALWPCLWVWEDPSICFCYVYSALVILIKSSWFHHP